MGKKRGGLGKKCILVGKKLNSLGKKNCIMADAGLHVKQHLGASTMAAVPGKYYGCCSRAIVMLVFESSTTYSRRGIRSLV